MIQMVVTDLDGTLLRNGKYISDYTISVLSECQKKGIKIAFATARSSQASFEFLEQFTPDVFIGYGGALVIVGEKVIHRFDISSTVSSQIIKECLAAPEVLSILAINESIALTNCLDETKSKYGSHYRYDDFLHPNDNKYLKISVNATSPDIVEKIAAHYPMCDMLRYTGEDLYRFANKDAIKWNAVKVMAKYYNFDTDSFVAFGDDVNDTEMVKNCGIGIAVENAIDKVKAVAGHICASNEEDGVAKWLEEHLL